MRSLLGIFLLIGTCLLLSTRYCYAKELSFSDIPADTQYIEIIGSQLFPGTPITIVLDFGQPLLDKVIIKSDDKALNFNTMIGALNYLYKNGWELVMPYIISTGNSSVYHFLLKRRQVTNQ